jgi:hypothetical protein
MKLTRRNAIRLVGAAATAFGARLNSQTDIAKENTSGVLAAKKPANRLVIYPFPEGLTPNLAFELRVRPVGKTWQDVKSYSMKVSNVQAGKATMEDVSVAYFDFTGMVEVSVTHVGENINDVRIRPISLNIPHEVKGDTITFVLDEPRNLSVEVNGDIFHNLHLFAGAPETEIRG